MMNQIHRHRAAEALHALERLADAESILNSPEEVTSTQLKKVDPRKKLRKWGVMSLQKYVKRNQEARLTHPEWARKSGKGSIQLIRNSLPHSSKIQRRQKRRNSSERSMLLRGTSISF